MKNAVRNQRGKLAFPGNGLPFVGMLRRGIWGCILNVFSPFLKCENKGNSGRDGI